MTLIVLCALLPIVLVSVVQGLRALENTRNLAGGRLNANAKAIAERERDPFIIVQYLLLTAASHPEVRERSDRCNEQLMKTIQNYRPIVNFVRSDADGSVRCSVLPYRPGLSLAGESWWQRGIVRDGMTVTPPVFGIISKRQVVIIMLPIRNRYGGQDGAISGSIDVEILQRSLAEAPEAKTGVAAIVSDHGKVVADSGRKLPFVPDMALASGKLGTANAADGTAWAYSVAPAYGRSLNVVYAEPRSQLMTSAFSQIGASILLPLVSILLASLAIWFGTHGLVLRWLHDLGGVAAGFSHGNFAGDREHFGQAPHEIATLSESVHNMADVLDKRNRELTLALEAKTDLTREVHHRVKNNLQIITSLLMLQATRIDDQRTQEVLGQTRARISALALIHRLLYQQETETERGRVALDNLMAELCLQLRSANREKTGIKLECETSGHSISVDHAVPLALFAVEAVTNAYRHAFAPDQDGLISLRFKQVDEGALLIVDDNGQGFATDDEIGQMGLELMHAFASQLGGTLKIESTKDMGSTVSLRFPISSAADN